jgi:hypothetical protein
VTESSEPQVSWKAIERYAAVEAKDGSDQARVVEVAGDPEADIFSGLVVKLGPGHSRRFLPAERVVEIRPHLVRVDLAAAEIQALEPYEDPVVERLAPESTLKRLRRWLFP